MKLIYFLPLLMLACVLSTPVPIESKLSGHPKVGGATPEITVSAVVCGSWGLNIRTGAGTTFPLVQTQPLEDGTVVTILESLYDINGYLWYRVTFEGGSGVVYSKYLCGEK